MSLPVTDRELLELAAKAAGVKGVWQEWFDDLTESTSFGIAPNSACGRDWWNPMKDDGDALRLALKFSFGISFDLYPLRSNDLSGKSFRVRIWCTAVCGWVKEEFDSEEAKASAVRLCIVRAAAEIGRAMP